MNSCMSLTSFVVPCFFTDGLVQQVSSVQTLVTHRACFSTEPLEVSPQAGYAKAYALRDGVFVKSTRDVSMLDIFQFHFQQSYLFHQVSSPQFFPLHHFFLFSAS